MKNINLKIQLNIQLREAIYQQWNKKTTLYSRELDKTEHGLVAELHWLNLIDRLCECIVEST